jgi:hypothetical protein
MSVRIAGRTAEAKLGVDLLRNAQHLIVKAVAIMGTSPEDGGLWDALDLIASDRAEAEAIMARGRRPLSRR